MNTYQLAQFSVLFSLRLPQMQDSPSRGRLVVNSIFLVFSAPPMHRLRTNQTRRLYRVRGSSYRKLTLLSACSRAPSGPSYAFLRWSAARRILRCLLPGVIGRRVGREYGGHSSSDYVYRLAGLCKQSCAHILQ